jgi:hypothetical protein
MVVLKPRSRLVTFRVSSEEYEDAAKACMRTGARSISEFARIAFLQRTQTLNAPAGGLSGDLMTLSRTLVDLDASLSEVRKRIRGILGGKSREAGDAAV